MKLSFRCESMFESFCRCIIVDMNRLKSIWAHFHPEFYIFMTFTQAVESGHCPKFSTC